MKWQVLASLVAATALTACVATTSPKSKSRLEILEAQNLLDRAGFNVGNINGQYNNQTETALLDFLASRGVEYDGLLSENEMALLRNARENRPEPIDTGFFLPEHTVNPSVATLRYYFQRSLTSGRRYSFSYARSAAAASPRPLSFKKINSPFVTEQMNATAMVSFLAYEDGEVIVDEVSPEFRFGDMFNDDTPLISNSVAKSFTSYLLGHAICQGYVDDLDQTMSDWSLINNTLYADVPLIDLINMRSGDTEYIENYRIRNAITITGYRGEQFLMDHPADRSIRELMEAEFRGSTRTQKLRYNYSGLPPKLVLNYIEHRMGGDITPLLNHVFRDTVRVENPFLLTRRVATIGQPTQRRDGQLNASAWVSRYDYLRIAIAMMEDWNANSCVGQYLREIYATAQRKGQRYSPGFRLSYAPSYAGFFHTGFSGVGSRPVLMMDGYGGQVVMMDMDEKRIVVINATHDNYDWRRLAFGFIQNGEL